MPKTTENTSVTDSRRIVEECLEFARHSGANVVQIDRMERRVTPRTFFRHQLRYCARAMFCEDDTKPAHLLDISLGGIGIRCSEALTQGTVIHVRLPLLDGTTAWVKGRVIYCSPDEEVYRVGIAFIFDQD